MTERREASPLPVGAVTGEALRYAGRYLETALRVVWAPVLILMAWEAVIVGPAGALIGGALSGAGFGPGQTGTLFAVASLLFALVPLVLTASYMAPLTLDAAGLAPVGHRTVPNKVGRAELAWTAGSVLSLGGLFLFARAPVLAGLAGLDRLARHAQAAEVATFEEGSLHASEVVPAYGEGLRRWLVGEPITLHGGGGIPTGAPAVMLVLGFVLLAYVWLRLFPLPAVLAAGGRGRAALRATLDASAGWNLLRLLAAIGLVAAANVALLAILRFVPVLIGAGLNAAYPFLSGASAFAAGGEAASWVVEALTRISQGAEVAFVVLVTALGAALNAGLYGAIVRRVAA